MTTECLTPVLASRSVSNSVARSLPAHPLPALPAQASAGLRPVVAEDPLLLTRTTLATADVEDIDEPHPESQRNVETNEHRRLQKLQVGTDGLQDIAEETSRFQVETFSDGSLPITPCSIHQRDVSAVIVPPKKEGFHDYDVEEVPGKLLHPTPAGKRSQETHEAASNVVVGLSKEEEPSTRCLCLVSPPDMMLLTMDADMNHLQRSQLSAVSDESLASTRVEDYFGDQARYAWENSNMVSPLSTSSGSGPLPPQHRTKDFRSLTTPDQFGSGLALRLLDEQRRADSLAQRVVEVELGRQQEINTMSAELSEANRKIDELQRQVQDLIRCQIRSAQQQSPLHTQRAPPNRQSRPSVPTSVPAQSSVRRRNSKTS